MILHAQTPLLNYVSSEQLELSLEDLETVALLTHAPETKASWLVTIDDFEPSEELSLQINLPDSPETFQFNSRFYRTFEQRFPRPTSFQKWSGTITSANSSGNIILLKEASNAYGAIISSEDGTYELLPIRPNVSVLRKVDYSHLITGACGTQSAAASGGSGFPQCDAVSCPQINITILALITPEYTSWLSTVTNGNAWLMAIIHGFITQSFGGALDNSDLDFVTVNIIDHTYTTFQYSSPNNIDTDVAHLATLSPSLRAQYNADKVVLLTERDYGSARGAAECVAQHNLECHNAIVVGSYGVNPYWTFAHEVGHLYGARHDQVDDNNTPWEHYCGHGYFLSTPEDKRTVMHRLGSGEIAERILHFSNPNVNYSENGQSYITGDTEENNAIVIKNILCEPVGASSLSISNHQNKNTAISKINLLSNIITETASIQLDVNKTFDIDLINSSGQLLISSNDISESNHKIDMVNLNSGLYFIRVSSTDNHYIFKIIKQ